MQKQFEAERFDIVHTDRVHVANHAVGHNEKGALDVWTTTGEAGTAFVRQVSMNGATGPLRQGVYGTACYFLRERASERFFFLERDARGFYLHDEKFFGASTYFGNEAAKVDAWLADRPSVPASESGRSRQNR